MKGKKYIYKIWYAIISVGLALLWDGSGTLLAAGQATSYKQVAIEKSFDEVKQQDVADKPNVMKRQKDLLERRYDLQNQSSKMITMSGGKAVQEGVRVKLPEGVSWEQLSEMTAKEIKQRGLFPKGFRPLPHPKHSVGGQVYPPAKLRLSKKRKAGIFLASM